MPTNTNDPYVPALSRHIFTAGGCSSGSHDQPSFNESSDAFTESWDGYIYVPNDIDNCVLTVSADDNAQFYSTVFGDDGADYDDSDDYEDDTAEAYKPKLGDIVIWGTVAM